LCRKTWKGNFGRKRHTLAKNYMALVTGTLFERRPETKCENDAQAAEHGVGEKKSQTKNGGDSLSVNMPP